MGFYDEISKYYDYIFPAGKEQLEFIGEAAGLKGSKILDIACGTGGYSVELAKQGYKVTAVDIEDEMIRKAEEKAEKEKVDVTAMVCSMTELTDKLSRKFDILFCIGNSIVHLGSLREIEEALRQMNSLMETNGTLIIQIINYDRIIKYELTELPPIINNEAGIKFTRDYEYLQPKNIINFNTTLIIENENLNRTLKNSVELLPIMSNELTELIEKAGFKRYECYGDFKYSPYSENSYMLVLKAFK